MNTSRLDGIITVDPSLTDSIRALADELEVVEQDHPEFRDVPLWSDVLINSGGAQGWMVAVDRWWGLMGRAEDLERLCASLVAVGRKREREIAGRIKVRASTGTGRRHVDTSFPRRRRSASRASRSRSRHRGCVKAGKAQSGTFVRTASASTPGICIGELLAGR
jgi:hypothetical protein